jgi:uracil-DNA glycosylase family 4
VDPRRSAYLGALGIDVYVRRGAAAPADAVVTAAAVTPPAEHAPAAARSEVAGLGWEDLERTVAACTRCALHETRTQTVFGVGDHGARWMFIGEAPGADEDRQGEPFVGRAGQLLTSMIRALGLRREEVYIANVLKCRPPGNRDPRPQEASACRDYLERQIELVDPSIIVAVGRIAAQNLLATDTPLAKLRGRVHGLGPRRRPLVVIYHPAYLLRSPGEKRKAWLDLLFARQVLERAGRGEPVVP